MSGRLFTSVTGIVSLWTRHARCREFASARLLLDRAGSYKLSHHALQDLICPSPRMLCKLTYVYARNAGPLQPGTTTKVTGGSLGKRCVIVPARFRALSPLTFAVDDGRLGGSRDKGPGPSSSTLGQTSCVPQRILCTATDVAATLTAPVPGAWGVMQLSTCGHPLLPHLDHPAPRHAIRAFALCPLDRCSRGECPPLQHRCLLRWSVRPLLNIGPPQDTGSHVKGTWATRAPFSLAGQRGRGDSGCRSKPCAARVDQTRRPNPRGCSLGRQGAAWLRQSSLRPPPVQLPWALVRVWGLDDVRLTARCGTSPSRPLRVARYAVSCQNHTHC